MPLTDRQVERYSRQIIIPQFGGRAQERLLASRLRLAGETSEPDSVLSYLVGAGVGTILLQAPIDERRLKRIVDDLRGLNPDAKVVPFADAGEDADAALTLVSGAWSMSTAKTFARAPRSSALIVARLDLPGKVAIMPAAPPCPACAEGELLAPLADRSDAAGLIAMVAAVETLRTLAGVAPAAARILEFDGLEAKSRALAAAAPRCACSGSARP
jgi:adenylyltransferase/sulfurtransferase